MERIAIIADDLTGASDTGIQFRKYGLKTTVIVDYQNIPCTCEDKRVWAINADTRPLTAAEAYERIFTLTGKLKALGFKRIYKKIGSTLRGHPGAELEAVMDALKADLALVVPAFPANGRVMINGHLILQPQGGGRGKAGEPVSWEGENLLNVPGLLQREMRRQVAGIDLDTVRGGAETLSRKMATLHREGKKVLVLDAATEEDLAIIARAGNLVPGEVVVAGAAGLAAHLPAAWGLDAEVCRAGAVLLIAGSRNPVTAAQVQEVLRVTSAPVIEVKTGAIIRGRLADEVEEAVSRARQCWSDGRAPTLVVIAVDSLLSGEGEAPESSDSIIHGKAIAGALGEITRRLVAGRRVRSLVITGGDTAVHICRALEARGIDLIKELLPGIPLGRLVEGMAPGMPVVTKAGGFGPPEAFVKVMKYLQDADFLLPETTCVNSEEMKLA